MRMKISSFSFIYYTEFNSNKYITQLHCWDDPYKLYNVTVTEVADVLDIVTEHKKVEEINACGLFV